MWRGLVVALLGSGCTFTEAELVDSARVDAQTPPPECRLDNTICAGLVAPELLGTPQYLRAHLVQRVGSTAHAWEVAFVTAPDFYDRAGYWLVIPHVAHEGTHFLAVHLAVTTSAQSRAQAELQDDAPEWVGETIEHISAEDFDMSRAARRGSSWFEAQSSRRTAPVAVDQELRFFDDVPSELPLVRGHAELEYAGWAGPFELDGAPVNLGIIVLSPCVNSTVEKSPLP